MTKAVRGKTVPPTHIILAVSIALWCYLFRFFLNGSSALQGDAYPYLGHIRFYLENIVQGIYPLWTQSENGNVNEFFLRRIGEFNPFFFFIPLLETTGFPFAVAHRLFLGSYFLLGAAGFYCLAFRIFRDRIPATTATLLLLFSSWGGKVFESFIVLEFVPSIWFAFFLTAFLQNPRHWSALGAVFCLMIINITYIPFYFYTILFIFLFIGGIVYYSRISGFTMKTLIFIGKNRKFSSLCCVLLLLSLIPGFFWYKAARQGEAFSVNRCMGAQTSNTAAVSLNKINEGGILPYHIFDRQFVNLDKVQLDDFYLPVFAFLMLLSGAWLPLTRGLVLWFAFGLTLFLIGLANASGLHGFLFQHIPFFKYFRNLQFFLWLGVIPAFIIFVTSQAHSLAQASLHRRWTTVWVILIHGTALLFCAIAGTKGTATYISILLSLGWAITLMTKTNNERISLWILWAAIIIQPFDVLGRWAQHYPPVNVARYAYEDHPSLSLPSGLSAQNILNSSPEISSSDHQASLQPYFAVSWYYQALSQIPFYILDRYLSVPFLTYDSIAPAKNKQSDIDNIRRSMSKFENIVFLHADIPGFTLNPGAKHARIIVKEDKDFSITKADANSLILRTGFKKDLFLVWTSNYHSEWRAYIDGKETPIYRANFLARGIHIPAGEHIIRWQYGPTWRYMLAYFFILVYTGTLGAVTWLAFRSKKA